MAVASAVDPADMRAKEEEEGVVFKREAEECRKAGEGLSPGTIAVASAADCLRVGEKAGYVDSMGREVGGTE
jgi:hypothetical protein